MKLIEAFRYEANVPEIGVCPTEDKLHVQSLLPLRIIHFLVKRLGQVAFRNSGRYVIIWGYVPT